MTDTTTTMDAMARAQKFVNDMLAAGEDASKLMQYAQRMKEDSERLADYASIVIHPRKGWCYVRTPQDEKTYALHTDAAMVWGYIVEILREDVCNEIDPNYEDVQFDEIGPESERIQMQADKDIAELRESLQPYGEDED